MNDGDWYNVDGNYVKEIEAYYAGIPASSLALPKFGTKTEPTYLAGLGASHPNLAVMDRKLIMIGNGKSRVEFCDLYSKSLDVVHVKQDRTLSLDRAIIGASRHSLSRDPHADDRHGLALSSRRWR